MAVRCGPKNTPTENSALLTELSIKKALNDAGRTGSPIKRADQAGLFV
jgi:hypothetical protein